MCGDLNSNLFSYQPSQIQQLSFFFRFYKAEPGVIFSWSGLILEFWIVDNGF